MTTVGKKRKFESMHLPRIITFNLEVDLFLTLNLSSASRRLLVVPRHHLDQHVRPPGFCNGWPDGRELSPGQSPGSRRYYGQLQTLVENVFVFSVPVQLAHRCITQCALQIYILLT